MRKHFFTSDLHLNHTSRKGGIIQYCNRPFVTIEEMNDAIIDNINSVVGVDDHLYNLGDFCFGDPVQFLDRIKCKHHHFVIGSHDSQMWKYSNRFESFAHKLLLQLVNRPLIVMTHCPHLTWEKSHYGSVNLFGHLHSGHSNKHINPIFEQFFNIAKSLDVGVDGHKFTPWELDEILEMIATKPGFVLKRDETETKQNRVWTNDDWK